MKNMTLATIAKACNGQLIYQNINLTPVAGSSDNMSSIDNLGESGTDRSGESQTEIAGVVIDSRKVERDFLFIATKGERVDGHDFINDVFDKGAAAVVCEKAPADPAGPYILVENSFNALKNIAKWYRMQLKIKVVGITGSVGKTSTKEFISSVLSQKYDVLKTEGNFNNEVGLPLTVLRIRDHHEIAVIEMGISDFGEMHRLSEIARPDICVLTNIGQCHLENLKSRQGVLKAKTEIFDFMSDDGWVCINGDDDMLATISDVKGRRPIRFGLGKDNDGVGNEGAGNDNAGNDNAGNDNAGNDNACSDNAGNNNAGNDNAGSGNACSDNPGNDVFASDIYTKGLFGSTCIVNINGSNFPDGIRRSFPVNVPLPGKHMILNALAAASVGSLLGLNDNEMASGIQSVQPVGGRSNIIRHGNMIIIDDSYNANPVSVKAAIDLLDLADTQKVAILGDMFELGANEAGLHREIGTYAAASGMDVLICVGKLSLNMYEGASDFKGRLLYFESNAALIDALPGILNDIIPSAKAGTMVDCEHGSSTILIKASRGMGFENVVKALLS